MKLVIVTDAWAPQISGMVSTMANITRQLREMGHSVSVLTPEGFNSMPCPGFSDIRLSFKPGKKVGEMLEGTDADAIHIATEGPLGYAARRWCLRNGIPFTTACHTKIAENFRLRTSVPLAASFAYLKRFHEPAHSTLVHTGAQKKLLTARGFEHLKVWPAAVDTRLFRPHGKSALRLPRPISMYVGRVAPEKGLETFLGLDLPGSRVVIGDGPDLDRLRARYPDAHFLGPRFGEELAHQLSAADVFVFPGRTGTLGLAMLEAMACGVPVAAFPVPGPLDVIRQGSTGVMDDDLASAVFRALRLDGEAGIEFARNHDWQRSARKFLDLHRAARITASSKPGYRDAPCHQITT